MTDLKGTSPATSTGVALPEGIVIRPWIGARYGADSRFGIKVLVVGESNYSFDPTDEPIAEAVNMDVQKYVMGSERKPFFTIVAKFLLNRGAGWLDSDTRREAWQDIAFTNFLPDYAGDGPRVSVAGTAFDAGTAPLRALLEHLTPDLLVTLGRAVAMRLPEVPGTVEAVKLRHPSSGFAYAQWNPLFAAALSRTQARAKAARAE